MLFFIKACGAKGSRFAPPLYFMPAALNKETWRSCFSGVCSAYTPPEGGHVAARI